jgi:hypothetical protein
MRLFKTDRRIVARVSAPLALMLALNPGASRGDEANSPAPTAGTRRALLVCGLPGDEDHRKLYAGVVEKLFKELTEHYRFPAENIVVRFGMESRPADGPALKASRGLSTRAALEGDVAALRKQLGPDDALWVIVLGHGHLDGRRAYLNLPGPDLDDRAFGKLFEGIPAREQVFFITTSASGFFLKPLAQPGRIVVTATEPDQEVNETLFPQALADVLAAPPDGIDRDQNGVISVFELYLAVVANVMQRYADDENLATEHAKLDDNGDGRGTELQADYLPEELGGTAGKGEPRKIGPTGDGRVATQTAVGPAPGPPAGTGGRAADSGKP